MSKVVTLEIINGNSEGFFQAKLSIAEANGAQCFESERKSLSKSSEIVESQQACQDSHREVETVRTRQRQAQKNRVVTGVSEEEETTNVEDVEEYLRTLKQNISAREEAVRTWFEQPAFREFAAEIRDRTSRDEQIRLYLDTDELLLKQLPWHLWRLARARPNTAICLKGRVAPPKAEFKRPVRILLVVGAGGIEQASDQTASGEDQSRLNLAKDVEYWERLRKRGAVVKHLYQPTSRQFRDELYNNQYDILAYSGHSASSETKDKGVIWLNEKKPYEFENLKKVIRHSAEQGLRLAVMNSCDGWGLADCLTDAGVPNIIFFRETVEDVVAHDFLREFLQRLSRGEMCPIAYKKSCDYLKPTEDEHPGASSLPMLRQNPSERSVQWPMPWWERPWRKVRALFSEHKALLLLSLALLAMLSVIVINWLRTGNVTTGTSPGGDPDTPTVVPIQDIATSQGETSLLSQEDIANRREAEVLENLADGYEHMKEGPAEADKAIQAFSEALSKNPNDPETLIFLSNAISRQNAPDSRYQLAMPFPISSNSQLIAGYAQEIMRGIGQAQAEYICGSTSNLMEVVRTSTKTDGKDDELALRKCNKSLEVLLVDETGSTSENVAKKIVDNTESIGVVGHFKSENTKDTVDIYKDKIVSISPTSTSDELSDAQDKDYIFRTVPRDEEAIKALFGRYKFSSNDIVSIVQEEGDLYSKTLVHNFEKQSDDIVVRPTISSRQCKIKQLKNTTDIRFDEDECFKKIKGEEANIVFLAIGSDQAVESGNSLIRRLALTSDKPVTILGGDSLYNTATAKAAMSGKNVVQLVVAAPWIYDNESSDGTQSFLDNARKLWGENQLNWRTVASYDAAMALITAMDDGCDDSDKFSTCRMRIHGELNNSNFVANGAFGAKTVRFDENGDRDLADLSERLGVAAIAKKCEPDQECGFEPYLGSSTQ